MSEEAKDSGVSDYRNKDGPDYFGFYRCLVDSILNRDEKSQYLNSRTLRGDFRTNRSSKASDSLFSNGIGASLLDSKRESLKLLLRQCSQVLSEEVDEILGPVLKTSELQAQRRRKKESEDDEARALKKLKHTSSSSDKEQTQVNPDVKLVLEDESSELDEIMTKHSDELCAKLEHMEHELEELLDCVMSSCRTMSLAEKKQLQMTIKGFRPKNLDRIAELVQRGKMGDQNSNDEVFVDLEKESNVTLWRLYFYAEALEKAKKLCD